jgi:hypothetical protein
MERPAAGLKPEADQGIRTILAEEGQRFVDPAACDGGVRGHGTAPEIDKPAS